jgi:hypothetical protein
MSSYPEGQWQRALDTASAHSDPATRERARDRAASWLGAIRGMLGGQIRTGSRTPVADLPAWVTIEVLHGGFASGRALADQPLQPWELAFLRRHGLPRSRRAMFDQLTAHPEELDTPSHIALPEEAALPVLGWLLRAGDEASALSLLGQILPFSGRLRFAPEPIGTGQVPGPETAWRATAGEVRAALERRRPNERVETMRTTLRVWNPFADRMLELWLRACVDGRAGVPRDLDWNSDARALLDEYAQLAAKHPPSRRHAGPKANLTVLRTAAQDVLAGRPWRRGLVQTVVDDMVRRRGPGFAALRARQARDAAIPPHHLAAHALAARLAGFPQHTGLVSLPPIEEGTPPSITAVVRRAVAAPVEELIDSGLVPSAEVLARLAPRIAAQAVSAAYPDPGLRALMAGNYLAFRNRRSLLLTNLASQVRLEELPWVRAVEGHKHPGESRAAVGAALRRLGGLTLRTFPGTLIPNPMVRELRQLSREAWLELPWVEELAADIFDGRFVVKFLHAAQLAGELLFGTIYEWYYGIDYRAIGRIDEQDARISPRFATLCRERAGVTTAWSAPAQNGMVIEQAQILTTHNLATLVKAGVALDPDGASRCFAAARRLAARPLGLTTIKDIAYAWRQMMFHLALSDDVEGFVSALPSDGPLGPAVAGLRAAVRGEQVQPFTGWSTRRHWMLPPR